MLQVGQVFQAGQECQVFQVYKVFQVRQRNLGLSCRHRISIQPEGKRGAGGLFFLQIERY